MGRRVVNLRKEILYLCYAIAIAVGLRVWILVVDQHNIYYEICAAVATFIVICVVVVRIRRALEEWRNQRFPVAEPHRTFSLYNIIIGAGLSVEAIDALPKAVVQNGKLRMCGVYQDVDEELDCHASSCSICLSDFAEEQVLLCLPCRHAFHRECLRSWLQRRNLCPLCKAPAVQSHSSQPGTVVLTNDDSSFFIHENIVYSSEASIQLATPRPAPVAIPPAAGEPAPATTPAAELSQV